MRILGYLIIITTLEFIQNSYNLVKHDFILFTFLIMPQADMILDLHLIQKTELSFSKYSAKLANILGVFGMSTYIA